MQALVFREAGDPVTVLACAPAETPVATVQTVLVKVAARPIHPADLAFIRGQYRVNPSFPQVAGLEGAGIIIDAPPNHPSGRASVSLSAIPARGAKSPVCRSIA